MKSSKHFSPHNLKLSLILAVAAAVLLFGLWNFSRRDPEEIAREKAIASLSPQARQAYGELLAAEQQYLPGIVCWGDSLTFGAGGYGINYPIMLEIHIDDRITVPYNEAAAKAGAAVPILDYIPVENMGVSGENSATILGRSGAVPYTIFEDIQIPATGKPVYLQLRGSNRWPVAPLRMGNAGLNYVVIDGILGYLSLAEDSPGDHPVYAFSRARWGLPKSVPAGTPMLTAGGLEYQNYLPIIFIGTNGGYESIEQLIEQNLAIINSQTGNPRDGDEPRYLVIGQHLGTPEEQAELETAMEAAFGAHYINLREALSTLDFAEAGLTPTVADREAMAQGRTPPSLMQDDGLHFNSDGYKTLAKLVYQRMEQLSYFAEIDAAAAQAIRALSEP